MGRAFERAVSALGHGASWLFLVAILISAYEVAMRYAFNAPSSWVHPTATALCAVAFALGGAWCMARDEHIRITFLLDRTGPTLRRGLEALALVVGLVYLAGFGYAAILQTQEAAWRFDAGGAWRPELTPGPPNWPLPTIMKASLALGAVLFLLVAAIRLARLLRRP